MTAPTEFWIVQAHYLDDKPARGLEATIYYTANDALTNLGECDRCDYITVRHINGNAAADVTEYFIRAYIIKWAEWADADSEPPRAFLDSAGGRDAWEEAQETYNHGWRRDERSQYNATRGLG